MLEFMVFLAPTTVPEAVAAWDSPPGVPSEVPEP